MKGVVLDPSTGLDAERPLSREDTQRIVDVSELPPCLLFLFIVGLFGPRAIKFTLIVFARMLAVALCRDFAAWHC